MNAIVVYDSVYGNTKIVAETIAKELSDNTKSISVSEISSINLNLFDLIITGSPINGWRPTEKISKWLSSLSPDKLKNIKAASFDTRIKIFFHGDAMNKISNLLKNAGAEIITPPECFYVKGSEGPLLEGEIEKAIQWAKSIKLVINK